MFYTESGRLQYDRCIEYNILDCFTFNPSDCGTIAVTNITFLNFVSAFGAAASSCSLKNCGTDVILTNTCTEVIYIKISLQFRSKLFKLHELDAAPNAETKSKNVIFDTVIVTQFKDLR